VALVRTAALLLRAHDYGDSSRILRFCSEEHGLISVVAHGVRGRSGKGTAGVSTFASGELTVYLKSPRDLHTMKEFSAHRSRNGLSRGVLRFTGASAVGELVLAHAQQGHHESLFVTLEVALDRLEEVEDAMVPAAVLAGLWTVTGALGFAPQMSVCARCGARLTDEDMCRFDFAAGGVRCPRCADDGAGPRIGPRARSQVLAFVEGRLPEGLTHSRRHLGLVSDFVAYHVISRPLKSQRMLNGLLPDDTDAP